MHHTRLLHSTSAVLAANARRKLLRVALVGAPNAGKSTLLNKILEADISCVSKKVHTTRMNILGVYTENDTQLEFLDTPGVINKEHMLKHRLENSFLVDPSAASIKSDIIVVLVDASNKREQRSLHRGVLNLLHDNKDKPSILVMNKVDKVKDKRALLDIGTRLTQGCLDGRCILRRYDLLHLSRKRLQELNLTAHVDDGTNAGKLAESRPQRPKHKYVFELDQTSHDEPPKQEITEKNIPDSIGYKNFSHVFSISALNDDKVKEVRDHLLSRAYYVEDWPHGPDYLSGQNSKDVVHEIIRGRVLDQVSGAVPYLLRYKYLECQYDELGSLHIQLVIKCPDAYMVAAVIGTHGTNINRIIDDSRSRIENTLKCEVKLSIIVEQAKTR